MVDVTFVRSCPTIITLARLKALPELKGMAVIRRGMRLSVQPVTPDEWRVIMALPEWRGGGDG
jgi:predicted RNA-binding protein with PUA-like domain